MSGDKLRLRVVLRNAVTWGAAWAVVGGAIAAAIQLFDPRPAVESLPERLGMAAFAAVALGVRFFLAGAVIGTAFAVVIRLGYRGRRLAEIHPGRFALLGAVVGGLGVPLYLQLMNVLSGDGPVAWRLVADDGVWAAVFGAAAAAGSILLARRAEARARGSHGPTPEQIESAQMAGGLPAGGTTEPTARSRRDAQAETRPSGREARE